MKINFKKALILAACAIVLVVASVLGTVAYFTAKDDVSNTFTVGKVSITMDETKIDADGITALTQAERVKENKYKLIPSHTYTKDPVVHVAANSEDAYIFIKVKNDIEAIETSVTADTIEAQILKNWTVLDAVNAPGVYYTTYTSQATDKDLTVFETFTIASDVDEETLADYNSDEGSQKAVEVTAYAIQKESTGTALEAWDLVKD